MFTASQRLVASVLALTLGAPAFAAEPAAESSEPVVTDAPRRAPEPVLHGHRYAFVAGGILLVGAAGVGYLAQGEARRAQSLESARDSREALERARTTAATANLLYAVAGVTLVYGLVLELLPEPAADAASLTFHF